MVKDYQQLNKEMKRKSLAFCNLVWRVGGFCVKETASDSNDTFKIKKKRKMVKRKLTSSFGNDEYGLQTENVKNLSIPAHFEPAVRTLRATLPAFRAIFPVSGNHHSGLLES